MRTALIALLVFFGTNAALFATGIASTYAKRFDDGHLGNTIVDGLRIGSEGSRVVLGVSCKGQDAGYRYHVDQRSLQAGTPAPFGQPLSEVFPATEEQTALAVLLVGGSAGTASYLERERLSEAEKAVKSRPAADPASPGWLPPIAIARAALAGIMFGYHAGTFAAQELGLDVDCSSARLRQKISRPLTWELLLGTAFTRAYASLHACVRDHQLRTFSANGVMDYADAPTSVRIGSALSAVDDTLRIALKEEPDRFCGPTSEITSFVDEKANRWDTVRDGRTLAHPPCWTETDVDRALRAKQAKRPLSLTADRQLGERMVAREFSPSERTRTRFKPTAADALARTMERLGKGMLIDDKEQATIGIDDFRLLLEARHVCTGAKRG